MPGNMHVYPPTAASLLFPSLFSLQPVRLAVVSLVKLYTVVYRFPLVCKFISD